MKGYIEPLAVIMVFAISVAMLPLMFALAEGSFDAKVTRIQANGLNNYQSRLTAAAVTSNETLMNLMAEYTSDPDSSERENIKESLRKFPGSKRYRITLKKAGSTDTGNRGLGIQNKPLNLGYTRVLVASAQKEKYLLEVGVRTE